MSDEQGQNNQPKFGLKAAQEQEKVAAPVAKEQLSPQQLRRRQEQQAQRNAERQNYAQKRKTSATGMKKKILPAELTSYDLWKFFACMLMIIDHVGLFFFPEHYTWFATVGKMCVPIWMFFIGYSRSRTITDSLLWGMIFLTAVETAVGVPVIPFDMLLTIIIARLLREYLGQKLFYGSRESYFMTMLTLSVLSIFTAFMWEFGIVTCMLMMTGYALRRENELYERFRSIKFFMYWSAFMFVMVASVRDELVFIQSIIMLIGVLLINRSLIRFTRRKYTRLTSTMPGMFVGLIQFFGRHSLLFYIAHLTILYGVAIFMQDSRFGLLDISLTPIDFEAMKESVEEARKQQELAPVIRDSNNWEW